MRYMLDRLVEIAKAADAFEYRLQDYTDENGVYRTPAWHLLGTARMGKTPGHVGGQQVAPVLGRAQPVHHRRQRVHDRRRGQPDAHGHAPWPCAPPSICATISATSAARRRPLAA